MNNSLVKGAVWTLVGAFGLVASGCANPNFNADPRDLQKIGQTLGRALGDAYGDRNGGRAGRGMGRTLGNLGGVLGKNFGESQVNCDRAIIRDNKTGEIIVDNSRCTEKHTIGAGM